MSAGNACAAIGLANTSKIPMIGGYDQNVDAPGPTADGPYIGVQGVTWWTRNAADEDVTFLVPAASGAAAGKTAQWVTSGASPVTVPADGRVTVTAGTAVAASGTGLSKTFIPAGAVIPAGAFFWAFLI
jgi:hypothetical protein